jgi:putative DNA primase/helicase
MADWEEKHLNTMNMTTKTELGLAMETEPWGEAVDGKALLDELAGLARRYVVLPKWGAETLALWILHTYAFELRDVTSYLGIESPEKRCGKTTLLTVLSELVSRPIVAANISSPAFFRVIEEVRPTLLIDEADALLRGNDRLRGILNAGYGRKTAFVVRVASKAREVRRRRVKEEADGEIANPSLSLKSGEGGGTVQDKAVQPLQGNIAPDAVLGDDDGTKLVKFSCWCPKAIAAIGRLPEALADRCLVIRMQRKTPNEACERLRSLEAMALRRRCARFVKDEGAKIACARPVIPVELNDRAADIWEPLLALAELAGGEWPERGRQAAVGLTASTEEANPIGSLLFDIFYLFTVYKTERIFSRELARGLDSFSDRPWMEMKRGKEMSELWLAQQLRAYGVRPRSMRIGEARRKGYLQNDLMEVFRRYIPRSEIEALKAEVRSENQPGGV